MGTQLTDLPALFDRRGTFLPIDEQTLATLPPERVELYANVRDAAERTARAEAELNAATKLTLPALVRTVADLETAAKKSAPTFHDLWLETVGRSPRHAAK